MLKMYYLQKEKHCLEKQIVQNNPRRDGAIFDTRKNAHQNKLKNK